ncbi:SDR family oxidoreductase [Photobacterium kishitanii]|uniref:dTDP-4-dehydrorhamnose reductase family protein n=1 Tax=Photobacterium kishitanii TaxID=318456 RepID=UPI002E0D0EB7
MKEIFFKYYTDSIITNVDVYNWDTISNVFLKIKPDIVINCIGLIKQHSISKQYIDAIEINSLLPHRLAELCDEYNAKLIHFSTDCVFSGDQGMYGNDAEANSTDLYGRSKALGEISYGNHLTLRTSIIGHELNTKVSLVDWFLSQDKESNGYCNAIFSGLPTCYIAKLLKDKILKKQDLNGIYNLSVNPIDKYTLLRLISDIYGKDIIINKYEDFYIDRSLNSEVLREIIDFSPPEWRDLIKDMHTDFLKRY